MGEFVPTLDRGKGYLPWIRGTYLGFGGRRYPGQVMPRAVRLLRLLAGLSCAQKCSHWSENRARNYDPLFPIV